MFDGTLLVGIGAAKCGTTWLADLLATHPQIRMSPLKETHWFDPPAQRRRHEQALSRDVRRMLSRTNGKKLSTRQRAMLHLLSLESDADYLTYLARWARPEHSICAEFTPSYSLLDGEDFHRIGSVHHSVRFIFQMRNPVDRFWSQYKFDQERQGRGVTEIIDIEELSAIAHRQAGRRGDYRRTLEQLWSRIPESSVRVLFYEDLFSSKERDRTLGDLWEFLDIDPLAVDAERFENRVNVTSRLDLPESHRDSIARIYESQYRWVADHFQLPESWRRDIERIEGTT